MKFNKKYLLSFLLIKAANAACPFGKSNSHDTEIPSDEIHENIHSKNKNILRSRRRLASLTEDEETRANIENVIQNRRLQASDKERNLLDCFSEEEYYAIDEDIEAIAEGIVANEDKGHFYGGIVRLAAHDFMDFDQNAAVDNQLGSDGCLDFAHPHNAGLDSIWCDDPVACPLKNLYDSFYSFLSIADFWIIAANSVIRQTSINNTVDMVGTFQWGRVDRAMGTCPDSSARLPEAFSCTEVEDTFLTRLGLEWRDAVALSGGHTLGRGDEMFSGHNGIWVDEVDQTVIFDKRYYEEILRRAWRPRNDGQPNQDWTWGFGNSGSPRFMLNTDICLQFDLDALYPCCTRIDRLAIDGVSNACVEDSISDVECLPYADDSPRKEAVAALEEFAFAGERNFNNDNNEPFYEAFPIAWEKATKNGWNGQLKTLRKTCAATISPTAAPTSQPTNPVPTGVPTTSPTFAPITNAPTNDCVDQDELVLSPKGRQQDCAWVISGGNNRCKTYAQFCPSTCQECLCLTRGRSCSDDSQCCSEDCDDNGQCGCKARNEACTNDGACCSESCVNGLCVRLEDVI